MQEDLKQIHEASMKILEDCGMKILHPEVLEIVKEKGVRVEGETAFFTREQVMEWIGKAPSEFKMYARNPKYDMVIGGDNTECAAGYGAAIMVDADGTRRAGLMSDYLNFTKLVHQSEHFNINGGILVQPTDVDSKKCMPIMAYLTLLHSDKCLMAGTAEVKETQAIMDMLGIVFGGKEALAENPRVTTIINMNSPLMIDTSMLDNMLIYIKHGQPVVIASAVMAGTTGPVTLAGTIALSNAEILAGITVAQMIKEGTPVIYGNQSTTSDMKTASMAIGSPEGALCYTYTARLAKAYGLPCRGGGAATDAKTVCAQSGYESMMTFLADHQAKMNFIIHSAGILDSYNCMSYEQFIVDLEIIGMVRRFLKGVNINEETLGVDVVKEVGVGGHFLSQMHTMMHCRKEPFAPEISIRGSVIGDANEKFNENIKNKKDAMLASYEKPEFAEDINQQLIEYLVEKGYDPRKYIQVADAELTA